MAHRIATQKVDGCGYTVSLKEIYEDWSIEDVYIAHEVLDLYETLSKRASDELKSKSRK